jgi:hypothetical protein
MQTAKGVKALITSLPDAGEMDYLSMITNVGLVHAAAYSTKLRSA